MFPLRVLVQIIKHGFTPSEPSLVILMSHTDACYQPLYPKRLLAAKFGIFEINVVDNLGDWAKTRIIESGPFDQNFQRAAIAFMGVLRLEHIEPQLTGQWLVSLCRNELELCIRINKATDKPRACHAIYMDAFTGNPDLPLQILSARPRNCADLFACSLFMHACFNSRDEPLCRLAAGRTKKIDGDNVGKTPFKPGKVDLNLCTATIFRLTFRQRKLGKATSFLCNLGVVGRASFLE